MWQRWTWVTVGLIWLASFALPALHPGTSGAIQWSGWRCLLAAGLLLVQGPLGQNNPEFEPGATLIGASVLVNPWFAWACLAGWSGTRRRVRPSRAVRSWGVAAVGLVVQPVAWSAVWGRVGPLQVGYYCWAGAVIAAWLLLLVRPAGEQRHAEPGAAADPARHIGSGTV